MEPQLSSVRIDVDGPMDMCSAFAQAGPFIEEP